MGAYTGVSRLTVGELAWEGVLGARARPGHFCCQLKTTRRMACSSGFSERIRASGQRPSSNGLSFEVIPASAQTPNPAT
jgi:DNA-binding GntR family transcriptional regulator